MLLTIGFATRDDVGAGFTLDALFMYHGHIVKRRDVEVVVVDNSRSGSKLATQLQAKCKRMDANVRYVRDESAESSCLHKERLAQEATGEYVLCCDSHVMFEPGSLDDLMSWHQRHPGHVDLVTGPCYSSHEKLMGTNQLIYDSEPYAVPDDAEVYDGVVCRGGNIGVWATDERGKDLCQDAFEVMQQGTGCFSFRREAWWGFHPAMRGHGGNETYLMEKVRRGGGRVMCLPQLRWVHSFLRAHAPYSVNWEDRTRNYLTGFKDLGDERLYNAIKTHLEKKCPRVVQSVHRRLSGR